MAREAVVILNGARTPMSEWVGGRAGNGKPGGALKCMAQGRVRWKLFRSALAS